jgi:WhiB family redox-sensing transcriptional regulator
MQHGSPVPPSRPPGSKGARPHQYAGSSGAQAWARDAACATADPEIFFPRERRDRDMRAAKSVCARCPVKPDCLQFSLETREESGIWGGLDEWERRELLDRQRRQRQHGDDTEGVA